MGSTARVARRWLAAPAVVALIGAGALMAATGSVSAAGQVSPTTNADDGSATSLRGILENLSDATTTVVLPAGSGPYVLDDCAAGRIAIDDTVVIEGNGNTVQQTCPDGVLGTDDSLTIRNLTVTGGKAGDPAECGGEQGGGILLDSAPATLTVEGSTVTGNAACDDGGGLMVADAIDVTITNSTISNNTAGDDGGGFDNEGDAAALVVTASTFSGNTANDLGGAIASEEDGTPFTITNSTITKNTSGSGGAISNNEGDGDDIALQYDTITDNIVGQGQAGAVANEAHGDEVKAQQGPEPASLSSTGAFTSFGTIITGPVGGPNCDLIDATSTASNGYNFSDDATCALTNTARGDRENAGSPGLGALGDNGGPTFTQLPQPGSPVIDQIPTGSPCGGVNIVVDQRGISRPQGPACEEGSVEVVVALLLAPDFTG